MTINTKFNINDEVWAVVLGQVRKIKINRIDITICSGNNEPLYQILYKCSFDKLIGEFFENTLFATEKELKDKYES